MSFEDVTPVIGMGSSVYALRMLPSPTRSDAPRFRHTLPAMRLGASPAQPRPDLAAAGRQAPRLEPFAPAAPVARQLERPRTHAGARPAAPSPGVLAHQSYLARVMKPSWLLRPHSPALGPVVAHATLRSVSSSPQLLGGNDARAALARKLAGEYRVAWLERELARLDALDNNDSAPSSPQRRAAAAAADHGDGADEQRAFVPQSRSMTASPTKGLALKPGDALAWDPEMLHDHILACVGARRSSLQALRRFADGLLPERSLLHRNLHPVRTKLRDDLSQHVGAVRLSTLNLSEALAAWEARSGSPLLLPGMDEREVAELAPSYGLLMGNGLGAWLPLPLGPDPLLIRWFGQLDAHLGCPRAPFFLPATLHSAAELLRMEAAHGYLTQRKWGEARDDARVDERALTALPTRRQLEPEHALPPSPSRKASTIASPSAAGGGGNGGAALRSPAQARAKLSLLLYGSQHGYERQQFRLGVALDGVAAAWIQAVARGRAARAHVAAERLRREELALAADTRVSGYGERRRRVARKLAEVEAALSAADGPADPASWRSARQREAGRVQLLARRLELAAALAELTQALALSAAVAIQSAFRARRARGEVAVRREARKEAMAIRLQACYRGRLSRRRHGAMMAESELELVEKELAWLAALREQAACRVQAYARRYLAKKLVAAKRRAAAAAAAAQDAAGPA